MATDAPGSLHSASTCAFFVSLYRRRVFLSLVMRPPKLRGQHPCRKRQPVQDDFAGRLPSSRRRRDHSPELKRELVRQCLLPGASVSSIAMAHGINANLVFKWRREHRAAVAASLEPAPASAPALLPITLAPATSDGMTQASHSVPSSCAARANAGSIELDFAGARLRLRGTVDQESLVAVLAALRCVA
ncbi:transposase [Pelomonas sp. P8]|uniref:Transposase n=1 Tax=Pelomonas cellulosilytica TaxID=2906762 RepID=A0ABS8XUC0_9BURK|nr:transposase [Pelomonas sp. P8]